jgi:hypothetical protein
MFATLAKFTRRGGPAVLSSVSLDESRALSRSRARCSVGQLYAAAGLTRRAIKAAQLTLRVFGIMQAYKGLHPGSRSYFWALTGISESGARATP